MDFQPVTVCVFGNPTRLRSLAERWESRVSSHVGLRLRFRRARKDSRFAGRCLYITVHAPDSVIWAEKLLRFYADVGVEFFGRLHYELPVDSREFHGSIKALHVDPFDVDPEFDNGWPGSSRMSAIM